MALWQYDTYIVPLTETEPLLDTSLLLGTVNRDVRRALIDEPKWGADIEITQVVEWLDLSLTRSDHWNKETKSWGHIDGNTIELTMADGKLVDVRIRFDLGSVDNDFLCAAVELVSKISGAFVGQDGKIFTRLEGLQQALTDSNAKSFVRNPWEYLESLNLDELNRENDV